MATINKQDWGFRLVAYPCAKPPPEPDALQAFLDIPGAIELQSAHPYPNNCDTMELVRIEGAPAIGVVFDPKSSTEPNYDVRLDPLFVVFVMCFEHAMFDVLCGRVLCAECFCAVRNAAPHRQGRREDGHLLGLGEVLRWQRQFGKELPDC